MAKELLVGKNGNKKTTDFFTWLNGLKYRVIEGYTWKNGLCYQFYGAGSPSVVANFWFFYKTVDRDVLITEINPQGSAEHLWRKFASGITFFALLHSAGSTDDYVLVLSTDADGIQCGRSLPISDTGTVTFNNTTWYWGFCNSYVVHDAYYIYPIDCRLPDYPSLQTMRTQGIQDVLAKIYADDFAEDYQVGNTYNLVKADIEKTIRKYIAMYLFLNVDMKLSYNYPTAYGLILSHIEDVVTYILQNKGNNDIVDMIADYSSDGTGLAFLAYYSNDTLTNVGIESYTSNSDGYGTYETDKYVAYNSYSWIQFKGDGTISYSTTSIQSSEMLFIGRAGYGTDYMELSNIGLSYQTAQHTIEPEYDYQTGQNYTIHNYLTFDDTIESTKDLFVSYAQEHMQGILRRASVIYMLEHWGEIKSAILSAIAGIGVNFTSLTFTLQYNSSQTYCVLGCALGSSTFPQQINIHSITQDPAGTDYYYMNGNTGYSRPPYSHVFTTYVRDDRYNVGVITQHSEYHQTIGIYIASTSSNYNVRGSNYGMKRV